MFSLSFSNFLNTQIQIVVKYISTIRRHKSQFDLKQQTLIRKNKKNELKAKRNESKMDKERTNECLAQ